MHAQSDLEWIKVPVSKRDCFQENPFLNGMTQILCSERVGDKALPLHKQQFHCTIVKALFSCDQEKEIFPTLEYNIY